MKQFLAKLLAFIVMFNCLVSLSPVHIQAAGNIPLNVDLTKGLMYGPNSQTPSVIFATNQAIPTDMAFMSWDMSTMTDGTYQLQYYIDDGKRITLTVRISGAVATVYYDAENWADVPANWAPVNTSNVHYAVHSNIGGGGKEHFVPIKDFLNGNYNMADPNFKVLSEDEWRNVTYPSPNYQAGAYYLSPMFKIQKDQGFSFQYENVTVHFKWNEADNSFYYATTGVKPGNLYDFVLRNANGFPYVPQTPPFESTVTVNTGFDLTKAVITPMANTGKTVDDVLDLSAVGTLHPGSPKVGLKLDIPVPKAWDEASHTFKTKTTGVLPLTMMFGNRDAQNQMQFQIDNMLNPTLAGSTKAPATVEFDLSTAGGVFSITLDNLKPNLIYDQTSIAIAGATTINARESFFDYSSVFTFADYDVVLENNAFFVRVMPYGNIPGYFMLKTGITENVLNPSVTQYSDGSTPILMPLTLTPQHIGFEAYYQLFFSPDKRFINNDTTGSIFSQIIKFKATPEKLAISTPNFFQIVSSMLMPTDFSLKEGDVTMTLKWDLGPVDIIASMIDQLNEGDPTYDTPLEVVYQLNQSLTPDNKTPQRFVDVKVSIKKDAGTGKYMITYKTVNPDAPDKLIAPTTPVELIAQRDSMWENGRFAAEVTLKESAIIKSEMGATFFYPNIYFLNVQPIEQTNLSTGNLEAIVASPSLYDSMTLSDISKLEAPPPQRLTLDFNDITSPKDEVSFNAQWEISDTAIENFLLNSYGLPKELSEFITTIYISQNQNFTNASGVNLAALTYDYDIEHPGDSVNNRLNAAVVYEFIGAPGTNTILFSDIPGDPVSWEDTLLPVGTTVSPRDALREDKIVAIQFPFVYDNKPLLRYIFDGLDKNQKYFACADLFVKQSAADTIDPTLPSDDTWIADLSKLSSVASITTKGEKEIPSVEEKVPTAPQHLDKKDVGLDTATIFWDKVKSLDDATETIEYEILRIKDNQIDEKYLNNRDTFADIWAGKNWALPSGEKVGFRTKGDALFQFNGTDFSTAADPAKVVYDEKDAVIATLKDNMLKPNQLYFYYVRTVKTIMKNGVPVETYSVWSYVSLTTLAVKGPKNLRIETGRKDYKPETEIYISFDAPLTFETLSATLGTSFNLVLQMKKEGEDWGKDTTMTASSLIASATASPETGYSHFLYKITGLLPSSGYSIRVRMIDIASGDASLYSNIATFRTDFNQTDYETGTNTQDWMDFTKEQMDKLAKNPYWTGRDTPSQLEIIYRPGMFESSLNATKDGQYRLVESKAAQTVYYIPASAYESANKANTGFSVKHGDMTLLIPPGAIDLDNNPAVLSMKNKLKDKSAQDYFVRILINWNRPPTSVEGNDTLGLVADVRFELVATTENIGDWDDGVLESVLDKIKELASSDSLKDGFIDMIQDDTTSENLSRYVTSFVIESTSDIYEIVDDELRGIIDIVMPLITLDKPAAIAIKGFNAAASVNAYHYESGVWVNQEVVQFGESKAVYTKLPGAYVFTGRTIKIPGIEKVEKGGDITGIVAKYGLNDYFGKDIINMANNASRLMIVGSVARMSGAPKGAEPFEWLKTNKGLTLSTRNPNSDISTQEALYLFMNLYETRTGTKIATLKIRNYAATSNITGLDDKYKQSVRAAFELGVYTDKSMQPKAPMTIGEALKILGALDTKSKL